MSDVLSHLVSRSLTTQSSMTILQPRLPSLFELPQGTPENSPHESEPAAPEIPPASTAGERSISSEQTLPSLVQTSANQLLQPQEPALRLQKEHPATLPSRSHEASMANSLPKEIDSSAIRDLSRPPELSPFSSRRAEQDSLATQAANILPKVITKIVREDKPVEAAAPPDVKTLSAKPVSEPLRVLQPVLPHPLPVSAPLPKSPREPEPQPIVEIHIGRVEVRATPAPQNPPAKPRSPSVMTLDEYLQRRRAGDRG